MITIVDLDKLAVGKRIKTIRINKGETTKEFAKHFNPKASDSLVSRWERGVNLPNNERIEKIAELGDMTVDELLNGNIADEVKIHEYFKGDIGKQLQFLMDTLRIEEATLTFEGEELDADTQAELLKSLESTYTMIKRILK